MNKGIFLFLMVLSFSCVPSEYSHSYLECTENSNGATDWIMKCISNEYQVQKDELDKAIKKNIEIDSSIKTNLSNYRKAIDKRITEKCSIYYLLDGDRGNISEAQCELDELMTYKKILHDFYEMHSAG